MMTVQLKGDNWEKYWCWNPRKCFDLAVWIAGDATTVGQQGFHDFMAHIGPIAARGRIFATEISLRVKGTNFFSTDLARRWRAFWAGRLS